VTPIIRVVGLGPGGVDHITRRTWDLLTSAPVVRLRTRVHPAAEGLAVTSYDDWYETMDSFEALYAAIAEDLAHLAGSSPNGEVVYGVPGSPVVAEHTVELLLARHDVTVVCEPAVSVIDVACAAVGVDPMSAGVRVVDALASTEPFRGPGPLLILQTYSPEIMATVADRLPPGTPVRVVHHCGLPDQAVLDMRSDELPRFADADHLTSLWVEGLRTAGEAADDLVSFTRRLRLECPWDQEQTHASLTKYLIEETYEALDALTALAEMMDRGDEDAEIVAHAEEELGDLLFQVMFHAELGEEESRFSFATIADGVRDKLTGRHPHVFGDLELASADEVAANWENLKRQEEGRTSVLDGIAWAMPALPLFEKVRSRATRVGVEVNDIGDIAPVVSRLIDLMAQAADENVDLEGALRATAIALAGEIRKREENS